MKSDAFVQTEQAMWYAKHLISYENVSYCRCWNIQAKRAETKEIMTFKGIDLGTVFTSLFLFFI